MKSETFTPPNEIWIIPPHSAFPQKHSFLAFLPKNANYAVYINESTQQPIRIYISEIKDYQLSENEANKKAVEIAKLVIAELQTDETSPI